MNESIMSRLKSRNTTIQDFNFDSLWAPPLLTFLTLEDIEYFRKLATSIKYSSKIEFKYSEIDRVMRLRGFKKLSAGTNRVVYRFLENDSIVIKVAIAAVAMSDNLREYENQHYLKPYVTKVFDVSPCGTVGLFERVDNIKSREEFESIAGDVYDLISNWIVGKYILEDIGSEFFMNYGVRPGQGPVLLDYPYMYELDGNKLYCQVPKDGCECGGLIDYDDGFNKIICTKCGAEYRAVELKKAIDNNLIIAKGREANMKISLVKGDSVVKSTDTSKQSKKFESKRERIYKSLSPLGSGLKITTSYDANKIKVPDEVKEEIESANIVTPDNKNVKFNTSSSFIPTEPKEEKVVEETPDKEVKKAPVKKATPKKTNSGTKKTIVVNEKVELPTPDPEPQVEPEVEDSVEPETNPEDLDPVDIQNEDIEPEVPEDDPNPMGELPVGVTPPPAPLNPKPRSKRYDSSFYENGPKGK